MPVVILVITERGERRVRHKPGGVPCPHLSFEGSTASCAVHELPEYKGSPCWTYGNSDVDPDFFSKKGRPCLVGKHVKKAGGLTVLQPEAMKIKVSIDDLEDLGEWPT